VAAERRLNEVLAGKIRSETPGGRKRVTRFVRTRQRRCIATKATS